MHAERVDSQRLGINDAPQSATERRYLKIFNWKMHTANPKYE
jgi:hypothetical protein